jgi:CheY-like chemotaxis protein
LLIPLQVHLSRLDGRRGLGRLTCAMSSSPETQLPDLSRLTILVVDDDDDSLQVLTLALTSCGAKVYFVRNAARGLSYIDTLPKLDVVVTDIAMPSMDGVAFSRAVRQHPRRDRASIPIIAVTAFYENYPNTTDFDAYVRKPVDLDRLCTIIEVLTRRARG